MLNIIGIVVTLSCVLIHLKSNDKIINYSADYFFIWFLCEIVIIRDFCIINNMLPILFLLVGIIGYPLFRFIIIRNIENENDLLDKNQNGKNILLVFLIIGEVLLLLLCFYFQYIQDGKMALFITVEKVISVVLLLTVLIYIFTIKRKE